MHKKRVEQALMNYYKRQEPSAVPTRKNGKPEKEVEKQVLEWCKKKGWQVSVVESKAVYSKSAGRYLKGQTHSGFSDVVGLTDQGLFVAIELKAPGRKSTLRPKQFDYLNQIICRHGFGLVTDSVEFLENSYQEFLRLDSNKRIGYLLSLLPRPKEMVMDAKPLFEE